MLPFKHDIVFVIRKKNGTGEFTFVAFSCYMGKFDMTVCVQVVRVRSTGGVEITLPLQCFA